MHQRIAHIGLGSALRMAGLIGLVVWIVPSLLLALAVVSVLRRLQALFAQLSSVTIVIPAQRLGPLTLELPPLSLDLVDRLGLAPADQAVTGLTDNPWLLAVGVMLGLLLLLTLFGLGAIAVAVLTYNVMAPRFGGVEVRVTEPRVSKA